MSLILWLPLNGNLDNNGIENVSITNNGATVSNSGKIGKCYTFTNQNIVVTPTTDLKNQFNNEASISCWVKVSTSHSTYAQCITYGTVSTSWNQIYFGIDINGNGVPIGNIADGSNHTNLNFSAIKDDVWHHLCLTYSSGAMKAYLDGAFINSTTTAYVPSWGNATVFAIGGNSSEVFKTGDSMNDVRLYNHCLSAKEVKEISKGLVLHYPLNTLSTTGVNLIDHINAGGRTTVSNNIVTTTGENADTYFYLALSTALVEGKTYRLSCVGTNIPTGLKWYFPVGSQVNTSCPFYIGNGYNESIFVANSTAAVSTVLMDDNGSTAALRANQSSFYDFNLEEVIGVYDCSGYDYNGTITGTLTTSSDSARYGLSTYTSSGDTNYIQTPTLHLPGDQITMTYWFKSSNKSPGKGYHEPFNDGITYELGMTGSGYLRAGLYVNGTRYVDDGTSNKLTDGSWHMCTMTYDGTTIKRYVDAVMEKSTTVSGTLATSGYFILGHLLTSSDYCSKEAYTSDVRLYTTALSATDIKELYETGQSIDNKGNIYAYEFKEE